MTLLVPKCLRITKLLNPGPKDHRIRGAFISVLKNRNGEFSYKKWKRTVNVASINWARGGREDDSMLSPILTTRYQIFTYHNPRKTLTVVVINAGKIIGKQYYIGGNQPVPKWLTEPTLDNDDWTNPDVEQLINGQGDIYLIQEAVGFEDGGAIANRLLQHSMKTAYFQKGNAPPLCSASSKSLCLSITSAMFEVAINSVGKASL